MTRFRHVAEHYDRIGRDYQESKLLPFRRYVEEHSTFGLLPDLAGRSVVDLACGDGIYARKLRRRGAARVVGVDISSEMIDLADRAERAERLGIEYVLGDVATVELAQQFDVAFCSYLFNYARSVEDLRALVEGAARLLRPGGLLVGCNDYPDNPPAAYRQYRQYGFEKLGAENPVEGSVITYRFFNPDGTTFELDNYYVSTDAYREVFASSGFDSFEWVMPQVSDEGREGFPEGFWDAYLQAPPIVSLKAVAGSG